MGTSVNCPRATGHSAAMITNPYSVTNLLAYLSRLPAPTQENVRFRLILPKPSSQVIQQMNVACGEQSPGIGVPTTVSTQVGTQVNVVNQAQQVATAATTVQPVVVLPRTLDIPIKVINPSRKRDSKSYMLQGIEVEQMGTLNSLREIILDQLGKHVVSFKLEFDVGYFVASQICFTASDDIRSELIRLNSKGKVLWCEGLSDRSSHSPVISLDSDSGENEHAPKRPRTKEKVSVLESKAQRVDSLANELTEKHGDKYNKIQYKLWAEALDVKRHSSKEVPPVGPTWGGSAKSKKKHADGVETMASAFTQMANSVASAFSSQTAQNTPTKAVAHSSQPGGTGISPGRRIDLQR